MALFPRKRGGCLPGCLLFVLLAAGGGYLWFRHTAPPPAPSPVVRSYTPAQAARARRHVEAARDALLRPAPVRVQAKNFTLVPVKTPSVVRVQLSEADLNTFLSTDPALQQKLKARGVQAVQVLLRAPDRVEVRAAVLYRGQTQNVRLTGTVLPGVPDGVRLHVTGAQAGQVPLPVPAVSGRADKLVAELTSRLPVAVHRVRIENSTLVLTGVRK